METSVGQLCLQENVEYIEDRNRNLDSIDCFRLIPEVIMEHKRLHDRPCRRLDRIKQHESIS